MRKKKNTYAKLRLDSDIKATERSALLSIAVSRCTAQSIRSSIAMRKELCVPKETCVKMYSIEQRVFFGIGIPQVRTQCHGHKAQFSKKI